MNILSDQEFENSLQIWIHEDGIDENQISSRKDASEIIRACRSTNSDSLYLSGILLTSIPDSIGCLKSLNRLHLDNNKLTIIPDSIGSLTSLTDLRLNINKLKTLPDSIINLRNLNVLTLDNNLSNKFKEISNYDTMMSCLYPNQMIIDNDITEESHELSFETSGASTPSTSISPNQEGFIQLSASQQRYK